MSVASAILLFEQVNQGIDERRLTSVRDVKIAVNTAISMLNSREESANTGDEDQFEILLELESLNEKRAKCEARLSRFQERAQQKETTNGPAATATKPTAHIPQQTAARSPIDPTSREGARTTTFHPSTSSSRPAPTTTDLKLAIVAFPGGPRTITVHPPGSPDFQPIIRDENGDIIIVFETRGQVNPPHRQAAFYGSKDAERAARAEVYGRSGKRRETERVPPILRPDSQPPPQPRTRQPQPSTTDVPTAESGQAKTFTDGERPKAPSASTSARAAPTKQTAGRPLKRCGARRKLTSPRASTPPSPSLGKRKGKERARDDEDEDTKEVDMLLTSQTPTPPRTDRRAEEPAPSPPPARRSNAVSVKDKEPTTSKSAKRAESSRAVEKPGPAKRRRLR